MFSDVSTANIILTIITVVEITKRIKANPVNNEIKRGGSSLFLGLNTAATIAINTKQIAIVIKQ